LNNPKGDLKEIKIDEKKLRKASNWMRSIKRVSIFIIGYFKDKPTFWQSNIRFEGLPPLALWAKARVPLETRLKECPLKDPCPPIFSVSFEAKTSSIL